MWLRLSQSRCGTTSLYSACRRLSSTWTLVRSSLHTCKAIFTTTGSSDSSSERNKQSFCQISSSLLNLLTTATHSRQSNLCKNSSRLIFIIFKKKKKNPAWLFLTTFDEVHNDSFALSSHHQQEKTLSMNALLFFPNIAITWLLHYLLFKWK